MVEASPHKPHWLTLQAHRTVSPVSNISPTYRHAHSIPSTKTQKPPNTVGLPYMVICSKLKVTSDQLCERYLLWEIHSLEQIQSKIMEQIQSKIMGSDLLLHACINPAVPSPPPPPPSSSHRPQQPVVFDEQSNNLGSFCCHVDIVQAVSSWQRNK